MRIKKEFFLTVVLIMLFIASPGICGGDDVQSPAIQQQILERLRKVDTPLTQNKEEELSKVARDKDRTRKAQAKSTQEAKQEAPQPKSKGSVSVVPQVPLHSSPALSKAKILAETMKNAHGQVVMPEVPTVVDMSNTDVNRITSHSQIKDVIYSKEKGLSVQFSGKDCYVKFHAARKGNETIYSTVPAELFIVSGDRVYNIIAVPGKGIARTVRLSEGVLDNIRKNNELFQGMPLEKKVLAMIEYAYKDNIPESFTVTEVTRKIDFIDGVNLVLLRSIVADGEGLKIKVYQAELSRGSREDDTSVNLEERNFLRADLTTNTIAIAISDPHLEGKKQTRIYICERNREEPVNRLSTTAANPLND